MRRPNPAHALPLALLLAAPMLTGCSSLTRTHVDTAIWVPSTEADFATINRSTGYTLVRGRETDVIVFESENRYSGQPTDRLTWILQFDTDAPLQTALDVGRGAEVRGWIIEEIRGKPSHAAPLEGTVSITQRTGEALAAVVNVYAITDAPTAGEAIGERLRLARRVEAERRQPTTIGTRELESRAGDDTLDVREKKD